MMVADKTTSTRRRNNSTWCLAMTLSIRNLVEYGSTSPETRFTTMSRKPSVSRPRRVRMSSHTSGRTARSRCVVIAGFGFGVGDELTVLFRLYRRPEGFIFAAPPKRRARAQVNRVATGRFRKNLDFGEQALERLVRTSCQASK